MTLALRWGVPVAVVAACVGYLIYTASGGTSEYYVTVSELQAHTQTGDVRVAGVVQDDVQRSDGGLHVTFTEKDGTASMPVEYSGALPDIFKPGITVVAEGRLGSDGVFHATALLAKCPSRFSTQPYTS
jgi:cytochrome c-type biogenesis protein CcmE